MADNPAIGRLKSRGQNDLNIEELLTPDPIIEDSVTPRSIVDAIYQGQETAPEAMDPVLKDMLEPPTLAAAIPEDNILDDIEIIEKDAGALQGPLQGDESRGGAMSSPGVRGYKLVRQDKPKKAKKAKKDVPLPTAVSKSVKQYISPRPLDASELRAWKKKEYKVGTTVLKGPDGLRLAYIVTSNAYKDRESEWVTTKALTGYVEKSWDGDKCDPHNLYLFWHSAEAIGDIVWADMQGPFLIEVAKERPNRAVNIARENQKPVMAMIKEVWDYIEVNPDKHDWGASQGFKASPSEVITKNYKDIRKFETSTLPLNKAANAYTFTGVVDVADRDEILETITGVKGATKQVKNLRKGVSTMDKLLAGLGVRHKEVKEADVDIDKGMVEDVTKEVEKFLSKILDNDEDVIKEVAPEVMEAIMQTLAGERNKGRKKKEFTSKENRGAGDADDEAAEDNENDTPGTGDYRKNGYSYDDPDASLHPVAKETDVFDALVRTQEGIVGAVEDIRKDIKVVKKLKGLPDALAHLEERLENVEKQLRLRPRSVSQDTTGGSVLGDVDGSIIEAIQKQLTEKDNFFDVHVRPQ